MPRRVIALAAIHLFGAALSGTAMADVTVKPAAKGYDIDITGDATASDLIDAIASATGVDIKGAPEDTPVGTNHLRNASLERSLRVLLPKAPFVVKSDEDGLPAEIIFLSPQTGSDPGDGADTPDGGAAPDPDTLTPPDDGTDTMMPDTPDPGDDGSQDMQQ